MDLITVAVYAFFLFVYVMWFALWWFCKIIKVFLDLYEEKWRSAAITCFIVIVVYVFSPFAVAEYWHTSSFVEDVDLAQVPTKGPATFVASIKISYKDGKLESVALINNTTIPLANAAGK